MDELDKTITKIVSKKINTPKEYHEAIQNTFNTKENKFKYNWIRTISATCAGVILFAGIAFAGYKTYEQKVWKEPRSYDELKEKPAIISEEEKKEAISEETIRKNAKIVLEKLGYPNKEVKKVELMRSYAINEDYKETYYWTVTENDFGDEKKGGAKGIYLAFNSKNGEFEYATNNVFDDIKDKLEKIDKQKAINIAKQTLKSLGADIEPYEMSSCVKIDKEEWSVTFTKMYNNIYNRYDEIFISFGVINGKHVVDTVSVDPIGEFDNNEFIITKEEAIAIAKKKELEFTNEKITEEITARKDIRMINAYIYCLENNIESRLDVRTAHNIRNVWVVKIKHKEDVPVNEEMTLSEVEKERRYYSKQYYIDATTGEIIGGDPGGFDVE